MNLSEAFRFAWRGITANKARSLLTMLGVLIGVTATIATLYRQHREIGHLRGEQGRAAPVEPVRQPPLAHGPDLPETY